MALTPSTTPKSVSTPAASEAESPEAESPPATQDQAQAAAFHERALQALADRGEIEYMCEPLANCLKLDPFNVRYRKTLRKVNGKATGGVFGRLFGSLNVLAIKSKMRLCA